MIHKHKTVIASLRNKGNVRVFIPEKLRIAGVNYVQPYKFMRVLPSTQPLIVSFRAEVALPLEILINEVVVTSPFSIQLIRSYLDQLCDLMPKSPAEKYIILTDSKRGDAWDPQFMAGKASFTAL
ncbi:MAG: hypothetical protein WC944_06085 [Candidatus Cloacimonadaceae bacterium]|jgi:hypothetical protein